MIVITDIFRTAIIMIYTNKSASISLRYRFETNRKDTISLQKAELQF